MRFEQTPLPLEVTQDPVVAALLRTGTFDERYYLESYPDVATSGIHPLVHYVRHGYKEGRNPCSHFDSHYYLAANPDVVKADINPLLHFCHTGWKELRKPSCDFDVWWYWSTYLDPASDMVNPLAHYVQHGQALGLVPHPAGPFALNDSDAYLHEGPVKRICLFAGYDPENLVDDYVVAYLTALSRHADIYYLADCAMPASELEKLRGIVKGAWASRHGTYDFGSYSMLAKSLVGWDRIEQYDELLLANDSCYLAGDLGAVFNRMDSRRCDWWGLQATKGIAKTRDVSSNQFKQPISMPIVRASMLDAFENDELYDFLIGSYFVAYRKPVINDSGFRKLLDSVTAQTNKQNIIQKYEIGLTRYLITRGLVFDTFIPHLYPFHPIYTNWHFRLIEEGFPLFKRYLLSSNHYQVPQLYRWKEKLQRILPDADTAVMERNLTRVTEPETLEKNLYIGTSRLKDDEGIPSSLLSDAEFLEADHRTPKYDDWWAFPVCAFTGVFSGNERAVYEYVKNDERIRKIVLTRDKSVSLTGQNLIVVPLESPEGQYYMLRAKVMFIKHTPTRNLIYPLASELHHLINLWHGIPLKRIGYASLDQQARSHAIAQEHSRCKAVISSSHVDTLAMAAAFYPLSYNDVWPTGLPRNDFIVRDFHKLPADLQRETQVLLEAMRGRKLVLFMPTFRNGQDNACFRFSEEQLQALGEWLKENNAVMGVREHMADTSASYARQFQSLQMLPLTADEYPNPEVLYRAASLLITDYSSCFIDFMLTNKPMISFAYDLEHYEAVERGLFYDLEHVFPGPVCRDFSDLQAALMTSFKPAEPLAVASYQWKKQTFFDHYDDCNSARLVKRIEQLLN